MKKPKKLVKTCFVFFPNPNKDSLLELKKGSVSVGKCFNITREKQEY